MRINVISAGREHLCDLTRELDALGHDVMFYSFVPNFRLRRFGLKTTLSRSVFWWVGPLVVLTRLGGDTPIGLLFYRLRHWWMDLVVSWFLRPAEVVIALPGAFHHSLLKAKQKFKSKIIIEGNSRHVRSRKKILEKFGEKTRGLESTGPWDVRRKVVDYDIADKIMVPATHVAESYLEEGEPKEKIWINPYAVYLDAFPATPLPEGPPALVMAGTWSYRKGCDVLTEAVRGSGLKLLHVGPVLDCPLPQEEWFESFGYLDQLELKDVYAKARIMVLASREEGLAFVQVQALASGLLLVCTDRTGGQDLRELIEEKERIMVVPHDDVEALKKGIEEAVQLSETMPENRALSAKSLENLSSRAYGKRYQAHLQTLVAE